MVPANGLETMAGRCNASVGAGAEAKSEVAQILSISSTVTVGHVGNSAAVFALQRLGHEVWPLTTIALPHHPGHGPVAPAARQITPPESLRANFAALEAHGVGDAIDAIAIGYMANAAQTDVVAEWVASRKRRAPDLLVSVDPILGDGGALYVAEDVALAARERLLPLGDIVTPNLFELEWLAGQPIRNEADAIAALRDLAPSEAIVTTAPTAPGRAANLLVTARAAWIAGTARLDRAPNGTGDLFAALYLGRRLAGEAPRVAIAHATASTFAVLAQKPALASSELALVAGQDFLIADLELEPREITLPERSIAT